MTSLRHEPIRHVHDAHRPMQTGASASRRGEREDALRRLALCPHATGPEVYRAIADAAAQAFDARWASITAAANPRARQLRTVALVSNGEFLHNLDFDASGSLHAEAIMHGLCRLSGNLKVRFRNDPTVFENAAWSLCVPLVSSGGALQGVLAVQHDAPLEESAEQISLIQSLATRAANALELEQQLCNQQVSDHDALHRIEELNRRLIDASSDCIIVLDLDGRLLSMSDCGRQQMLMEDDASINSWLDWWPKHRSEAQTAVRAAAGGGAGKFEGCCFIADGSMRWWDVIVTPILDAGGSPEKLLVVARDVTERREAEERLRESQRRLSAILSHLPGAAYRCTADRPWTLTYVSSGVHELTGYAREDFQEGRISFLDLVYPDDIAKVEREVTHAIRERSVFSLTYRILHRDGDVRWVDDRGQPIFDEHGTAVAFEGFLSDTTERAQADAAQRRQAEDLKTLLDTLPVGVLFAHDTECQRITGNHAASQLLRMPPASNLSKSASDEAPAHFRVFHQGVELQPHELPVQRAARGEKINDFEIENVFSDGTVQHALISAAPLFDPKGALRGAVTSVLDITERKQAERALREREEQYELVLAGSEAALWDWDVPGKRVNYSPRWKQLRGLADQEVSDSEYEWLKCIHPDDYDRVMKALADHFEGRTKVFAEEYRIHHKDGHWIWILDRGLARRNDQGEVVRMAGSEIDITARKEAEERLQASEERYRTLVDVLPAGVYACAADGMITAFNRRAAEIWGCEPTIGDPCARFCGSLRLFTTDGTPLPHDQTPMAEALKTGEAQRDLEVIVERPDGSRVTVLVNIAPLHDEHGKIAGAINCFQDITVRKRAQEAQARLATIVETSEDCIISKTLDGTITSWNHGAERTFGYTAEEAIGKCITMTMPPDRVAEEDMIRARLVQGLRVEPYETIRITKDGRLIDVWVTVSPVMDSSGRIIGASAIARDITDRKRAESLIRESEARLTLAMEAGHMGAWDWDVCAGSVKWSPGLEMIHGIAPGEFGGTYEHFEQMVHRDDLEAVRQAIKRALATGDQYVMEYRILRPDGVLRWIEARGRVITSDDGEPVRMTGVSMDITERKAAIEEAMAQAAFREAVETSVAAGLVGVDLGGRHTYVNRAFCEMTGLDEMDLLSRTPPFPYWPREDAARIQSAFEAMLRGNAPATGFETRFRRRDGSTFDVLVVPSPLRGPEGKIVGWLGAVTDITSQKRNEAELARHRDQLEELVIERTVELEASYDQLRHAERMAALGTLSAGLGHDMGNLLLPLRLRLDAIERKVAQSPSDSTQEIGSDVEAIRKCAEYMQRLTNGLRLFALDPNDESASEGLTDIQQWWQDVEPFLKNALPKSVELEREIPEQLPAVALPRHLLTQAVFNLVQNAGDAARESEHIGTSGTRSVSNVCLRAQFDRRERIVRLSVSDDGPGMTEEVRKRCMEPFFTTKPRGLSTGLGLALVHGIIIRANGRLDIDTAIGKGTTMTLTLPAVEESTADSTAPVSAAPSGVHQMQALISVSDPRMSTFAASVLRALSFEVEDQDAGSEVDVANVPQADLWVTDDPNRVESDSPRLFANGGLQHIVLVCSQEDKLVSGDRRISHLDPSEGRAGCWRVLRNVSSEIRKGTMSKS